MLGVTVNPTQSIMKSTRKYILAVCALAIGFAVPTIRAEDHDTPPPKKEGGPGGPGGGGPVEHILKMKEKLGLTENQMEQLKKIGEDTREAMKALREKEGDRESKKDDMKKIRDAAKTKVEAVLTAEQKSKLAEMRKKHEGEKPKGEKGDKEKGPKGPPHDEE
jgi:Spy/CpxP family protein refolding chaperone